MMDVNSVTVSGRLTRDPELKYTSGGTATLTLSLAHEWSKKGASGEWEKQANFFDVKVWGKIAEWLAKDLTKGTLVSVQGELRQERWEKDGHKNSRVVINADKVSYQAKRREGGDQGPAEEAPRHFDDDIPF
jgi:single-strand DNA-binding protein